MSTDPTRREAEAPVHEWLVPGVAAGLLGGIALAVPLVVWDSAHAAHLALELPMAVTAWLFGLEHFSHSENHAWPIVIGLVLLAGYCAVSGLVYARLAEALGGLRRVSTAAAGGLGWGVVSFLFFWNMLLPIARDGAPFRVPGGLADLIEEPTYVAPNWVWILGFTLMGLVTGLTYAEQRLTRETASVRSEERIPMHTPSRRAA